MVCFVSENPDVFAEIEYMPAIEGGLGPVKLGTPVTEREGVPGRRYACCHHWPIDGPDVAWAEIYGAPDLLIYDGLPPDWRYLEAET